MAHKHNGEHNQWNISNREHCIKWLAIPYSESIVYVALGLVLIIQAISYWNFLTLSLGPRVVLQPWLMRNGFLLYRDIADEHAPLMYLILTLLQPLSQDSLLLSKAVLVLLISLITALLFSTTKRGFGDTAAIIAIIFFAVWSPVFGFGKLWHETFLSLIYLTALLLWQKKSLPPPTCSLLRGLLGGIGLLLKQHAIVFNLLLIGLEIWDFRQTDFMKRIRNLFVGILLPPAVFTLYYQLSSKTLQPLVFWTVTFSLENKYAQLAALPPSLVQLRILTPAYMLVIPFALLDSIALSPKHKIRTLLLFVIAHLTAYPRFGYFHLQPVLPLLAWMSGIVSAYIWTLGKKQSHFFKGLSAALLLLWSITGGTAYTALFDEQPQRIMEYTNLIALSENVRQYIGPSECNIYVFPDDEATANLYYLLRCMPPKPWSPTSYPWFTLDSWESILTQSLRSAPPRWVIYFPGRWEAEQHASQLYNLIRNWCSPEAHFSWDEGEVQLLRCRSQ